MSRRSLYFVPALALALLAPAPAIAQTLALTGGTVHTVSGGVLPNATVLVRDGKIVQVGSGIAVPSDAKVFDCAGKHVYPGYVAANTVLGIVEINSVEGSNDTQEVGNINPNVRAEVEWNPDSDMLPVTRVNGVTSALVIPRGGVINGTSALMHLDGWTYEDMTVRAPVALHVQWPNMTPVRAFFITQTDEEQKKQRDERIDAIRRAFDDARAYWKAHDAERSPGVPRHDGDVKWDAMSRAIRGEIPVFFHADQLNQIQAALKFADEEKLKKIAIVGGQDAWRIADQLRARDIPVICGGTLAVPARRYESYDAAFTLPAKLQRAGVRFCITDGGGAFAAANARNLPYNAAMAASFGLPKDEALKAVTLYPAQILGAGDKLGSIEVGKLADLFIADGDPLEITTKIEQVFIGGKAIPMENRQTRLYEKYDHRPKGPKARKP